MGLSYYEKRELDNMLKTIVAKVNDFTTADVALFSMSCGLKQLDHSSVNASAIKASLERLQVEYKVQYPSPIKYIFDHDPNKKSLHEIVKDMVVVNPYRSFYKDKNILHFEARNMNMTKKFSYDFITKENDFGNYRMTVDCCFNSFDDIIKLFDYEWIFNYVTSFVDVKSIIEELKSNNFDPKVMPKNFSRYLDIYGGNWRIAISRCQVDRDYSNYSAKERGFIFQCLDIRNNYKNMVDILPPSQLLKLIENTICFDRLNYTSQLRDLIDAVEDLQNEELEFTLDTNRTLEVNVRNAENLLENHRNKELNAQLQKLNFINAHKLDGYVVIVPQNQAEKIDEGRQQNNCVGYYYDESILDGRNYIYFVRKIGSPDKSYLTCRFNKEQGATVEARYRNNVSISSVDTPMIKAIDKIINLHIDEL